jgi:hypothetical protein
LKGGSCGICDRDVVDRLARCWGIDCHGPILLVPARRLDEPFPSIPHLTMTVDVRSYQTSFTAGLTSIFEHFGRGYDGAYRTGRHDNLESVTDQESLLDVLWSCAGTFRKHLAAENILETPVKLRDEKEASK